MIGLIGLSVIVIIYGVKLNEKIEVLERKIESLKLQLNGSSAALASPGISDLQEFYNQIAELRNSIGITSSNVRQEVSDITVSTNQSISELWEHIEELEELEESLAGFNVSLRQKCYEERETCTLLPAQGHTFYRGCRTALIHPNISVSRECFYIIMQCVARKI